jgi:hypothetical protein
MQFFDRFQCFPFWGITRLGFNLWS